MTPDRNQPGDGLALAILFGVLLVVAIVVIQLLLAVPNAR